MTFDIISNKLFDSVFSRCLPSPALLRIMRRGFHSLTHFFFCFACVGCLSSVFVLTNDDKIHYAETSDENLCLYSYRWYVRTRARKKNTNTKVNIPFPQPWFCDHFQNWLMPISVSIFIARNYCHFSCRYWWKLSFPSPALSSRSIIISIFIQRRFLRDMLKQNGNLKKKSVDKITTN